MRKITSFLMVLFVALGTMAQTEATATLVHTASSYVGGTSNAYTSTVDAEKEHINNSKFGGNTWQGAAYAEFSMVIPEGHSISSASLTWSGIGSSKNRTTDVMYVNAGLGLDYETMASTGTEQVNLGATTIATVTFLASATTDFTTDVTDAVKTIIDAGQTYVIFKFTNNAGGGDLVGKGATEKYPVLTIETAAASAMTTYTVKYVDGSGNEIKEASVYDILTGEAASVADENKAAIYKDDKKYIYVSCDKESITTVADGASNVITVTFREAESWNYTANAVDGDGNVLKVLATGSNFEGETVTVFYSRYILKDGVLYEKAAVSSQYSSAFALSTDGLSFDIVYGKSATANAVYFSEAEDIESVTPYEDGYTNIRMSNGAAAYATELATITSLPAGVYTLTSATRAGSTTFYAGSSEVLAMSSGGSVETPTSEEFTLYEPTEIKVSAGSNKNYFDYVLICRVGDAPIRELVVAEGEDFAPEYDAYSSATYTRTIAEGAYGTICLPFAPDAASLENYSFFKMVSAGTDAINFVEETAPVANTPYIYCLKGENVAITGGATVVSASITDVKIGNWTMKGSFTTQSIATEGADAKYYGYVAADNKIVKANKTLNVKPYRAYFTAPVDAAAVALRITRGDETTEITAADLDVQPATVIYDLAGRRVEKMEKGIYIVNGKKVIK